MHWTYMYVSPLRERQLVVLATAPENRPDCRYCIPGERLGIGPFFIV